MNHYEVACSACLLGLCVRYDGNQQRDDELVALYKEGKVLPICPEVYGGLSTPRIPCEIVGDKILNKEGIDQSDSFERGTKECLALLETYHIQKVYLKDKSPSCGSTQIYDGSFSGRLIQGEGIFAKACKERNIKIETRK